MIKKQILIIRHGETDFNRRNIVQGSGVDTDLNELGQQQAGLFYEAYKAHPFEVVYTSALKRSGQSVSQFLSKGIRHIALPELNEISWGDFEGRAQTPEQREKYWETVNQWRSGQLDACIPNGESAIQLQQRQKKAAELILRGSEEQVLVCMHGRAMKSFLCLLLDKPLTQMEDFQHTNLCLYHLEYDGSTCRLVKGNDTSHLNNQHA
jgi:phosphoserine phosphatase